MEFHRALLFHSVPEDPFQWQLLLKLAADYEQSVKEHSTGTS